MKIYFDHEKLQVYQDSLQFVAWLDPILERIPKNLAVRGQLDRASTSIVLNIPEGNGKYTSPDRCKYFDTARGSSLECAGCLDLLKVKKLISEEELDAGKERLRRMVSMLVGLIKSNSPDRMHELTVEYRIGNEDGDRD